MLRDKGRRVDPREYGGAIRNANSIIVSTATNSTGLSDVIKLVDIHLDKEKNIDPRERGHGMAKYEPGPARIDFQGYSCEDNSESGAFRKLRMQPLQSLEPDFTSPRRPCGPTLQQPRWHPKISPYCLILLLTPVSFGTAKAIISQKGGISISITIGWVFGLVVILV